MMKTIAIQLDCSCSITAPQYTFTVNYGGYNNPILKCKTLQFKFVFNISDHVSDQDCPAAEPEEWKKENT